MNLDDPRRHLDLEGGHNIRDIGGYPTAGGRTTRWRTLLRSGSMHELTPVAQQALYDLPIGTIIDLRRDIELTRAPNVFASGGMIRYRHMPLLGPYDPLTEPEEQAALYRWMLDTAHAAIAGVIQAVAEEHAPVLIHCVAGKDRTGLVVALMLAAVGVADDVIVADYALSNRYLARLHAQIRLRVQGMGGDVARLDRAFQAPPEAMQAALDYVRSHYDGVDSYLRAIGVSSAALASLRRRLVA